MKNIKHFNAGNIGEMDRRFRANLINSISGYKPANLVGTIGDDGTANLAIFSSVVHLGSDPALLGLIVRPAGEVPRHTYENIQNTGVYTINHVHEHFVERAHWTSAKFGRTVSEFEKCGLTQEFVDGFRAPFVGESEIKIGLELAEEIPINLNKTILIIGEVKHIIMPEPVLLENGSIDLNGVKDAAISGLDTYHRVEKIETFPYAKPINLPAFNT
jgi:flavin reductase (DIM6/NTAB) family NADH-FMN oxidoreductase RutF